MTIRSHLGVQPVFEQNDAKLVSRKNRYLVTIFFLVKSLFLLKGVQIGINDMSSLKKYILVGKVDISLIVTLEVQKHLFV